MPELNRRRFLQVASAAGLMPLIPALPASAAATSGGATSAQMLWANLYARAGSATNFAGLTNKMGLSSTAANGVYSKIIQSQVLTAHSVSTLSRHAPTLPPAPQTPATLPSAIQAQPAPTTGTRAIKVDIKKLLDDHLNIEDEDEPPQDEFPDITDPPE